MKRWTLFLIIILFLGSLFSCSKKSTDKIEVATSISVLSSVLSDILPQDKFEVFSIIPDQSDPHTFSITPETAMKLSQSSFVIYIGKNFDNGWIDEVSLPEGVRKIDLSSYLNVDINNPHYWVNIPLFVSAMDSVVGMFFSLYGDSTIYNNWKNYKDSLVKLHDKYKAKFDSLDNKKVSSIVPAFSLMLKDMGVEEIDILIKHPGKDISPSDMMSFIKNTKENNVSVVLNIEGGDTNYDKEIEKETGCKVLYLSPLLGRIDSITDFRDLMEYNYENLYRGLCGKGK